MLKRVSDWTSDTTVPTAKPEQSRSRDQRLTSVRSQGWLIRSKRSLVRGLGLPALMVSPGSLSSRQVSRGYSAGPTAQQAAGDELLDVGPALHPPTGLVSLAKQVRLALDPQRAERQSAADHISEPTRPY